MLPGKTYKPEDILKILRKRIWVVVLPWMIIAAGTAAVARKLPDMYRSFATIQVTPPQVPNTIVQQMTTTRLQDRLNATQQSILSRTRLEHLIQEFDLYNEDRTKKHKIMEDVVQGFRDDITIAPFKGETFTVSYVGRSPATVMKVTERLAGYFKEENAKEGQRQAEGTSSFVESQVEEAHRKLVAVEQKRTQYQLAHVGEMPEQLAANMQAVQNINQQLAALAQQNNIDANARAVLERQIGQYEAIGEAGELPPSADPSGGTATQRLTAAKAELSNMLDVRRMKPDHPDVKILQNAIKKLQEQADAEALKGTVGSAASNPAEAARLARIAGWKEDLERLKKQTDSNKIEEQRLKALAGGYQARIDRVPARQAELVELNRDYELLNKIYLDLVAAREKSGMSVNLENRQMGEQFVLLDAARMPEKPFSPNRTVINLLGILGGLGIGLAAVVLIEYRDTTFKTDSELTSVIGLPVLAVVPSMRSEPERRADFRRSLYKNVGFATVVLACLAVLTYSFVFPH